MVCAWRCYPDLLTPASRPVTENDVDSRKRPVLRRMLFVMVCAPFDVEGRERR